MKGLFFRKSIQLLPGVRLNISKSGFSLSLGPKGAHVTTGSRGTHLNLDLPGSGLYYRTKLDVGDDDREAQKLEAAPPKADLPQQQAIAPDERELVEAVRALQAGKENDSYSHAQQAVHLADGAFLAGFLALKREQSADAAAYLKRALEQKDRLGEVFSKYDVDMEVDLPITEDVTARIQPNENGLLLALAEAYQHSGQVDLAIDTLRQFRQNAPQDMVVRLSLAELLDEQGLEAKEIQQQIIQLAEDVQNESPIHAGLMFYRARALRKLGLLEGARDTLNKALQRKKDYPNDLLLALQYERALVYEVMGQGDEARKEFQKIYAEAPSYEDVAAKLGL